VAQWPTMQWPTSLQAVRRGTATLALATVARNAAYLQSILFTKWCALRKLLRKTINLYERLGELRQRSHYHILPAFSFGGGNCPSTFITDDSDAERNALHSAWPSVRRRGKKLRRVDVKAKASSSKKMKKVDKV